MCYAIPGKVVGLKGRTAVVDYFGEYRKALNELRDVKIGDYVYAQGGILVQKISQKEAAAILKIWEGRFFQLKGLDSRLSKTGVEGLKDKEFESVIEKAGKGDIKRPDTLRLLKTSDEKELELLFKTANKLRHRRLKNSCCVHGIIEFSNQCRKNCLYCGVRRDNKEMERYRLGIEEIVEIADHAVNELGFKALVLQSGEDPWYTKERLVEMIKRVKDRCPVLLFMSVGERSPECYKKMYEAGARGILLRFETSNPDLYRKIRPRSDLQKRLRLLRYASRLGYIIATGSLIGLPGQTEEDLMNDILLTKSLGADMYSFGPLIPHPETPLAKAPLADINTALKVLAVSRLVDPESKILVTTALETLDKENGRQRGLLAGANSLMINVTPRRYRGSYTIYPGRPDRDKEITQNIQETLELLYSLGRAPTDLGM